MPLSCAGRVKYRYKKGAKVRLAYCNGKVIEHKKMGKGKKHG